ncbi:MAG TPA: sigma-70 family RNA polymerase sigma factor [Alphaproteobacteria bacterium]|nr:sigma-70 family RNA polymerase sigma factor [Micavibrio sp.]HQX26430.1 sigma-70 family RNA polymerase sigma factor [Alphaproteobacteria bacterium]
MFEQTALVTEMKNLRKFAFRLTGNPSDAEDLLQSTVLRALEKKHLFQKDTDLFKWTSKIMFNLFVSEYRRRTKFETQYDPETYLERQSVEGSQEVKLELSKVKDAMKQLSADHQEILVLVCVKGMRYEEVSEALEIPVGTVRSRLARARENLQIILDTPVRKDAGRFTPPHRLGNERNMRAAA